MIKNPNYAKNSEDVAALILETSLPYLYLLALAKGWRRRGLCDNILNKNYFYFIHKNFVFYSFNYAGPS